METKLKCLIYLGLCDGIVEIIQNPNDDTIACRIGEYWFYFIGSEYENLTPDEVYETFTKEELTELIISAMIELDKIEIEYYEMFLKEKINMIYFFQEKLIMEEKWVCTDPDSSQYRKINADGTYTFIEKVWLDICEGDEGYPDKEYTVKSAWIDLNDYSDYEKECAISGYYKSMDEIYEQYGMNMEDIIAECIFEEMSDGSATTHGMMTEKEADEFIQKYIIR